ncbi:MAG: hypothetical protein KC492_11105 [Myxococcales bacterium]|nr:hypothetical protein [Myxococcales bacterium]
MRSQSRRQHVTEGAVFLSVERRGWINPAVEEGIRPAKRLDALESLTERHTAPSYIDLPQERGLIG